MKSAGSASVEAHRGGGTWGTSRTTAAGPVQHFPPLSLDSWAPVWESLAHASLSLHFQPLTEGYSDGGGVGVCGVRSHLTVKMECHYM